MQEKSRGIIGRLFSGLWRLVTWIRVSLANLVFLLAIIFLVVIFSMERLPTVPERAALILSPSGQIVEKLSLADPLHLFGGDSRRERETLLKDLIDAIDRARDDGVSMYWRVPGSRRRATSRRPCAHSGPRGRR